jgi:leader peptidase (prepilin peptidase)/N-methyltransferase
VGESSVRAVAAIVAAAALAVATLVRFGVGANGAAWAVVQVVLVGLAWIDLRERRLPNALVVPLGLGALVARAAFVRGSLVEVVVAGAVAFAVFLLLALVVRGGLGMGDVKLAAAEGLLLGRAAVDALVLGVVLGGLAAVVLLLVRRAGRASTYAYGPYLALGAAIAILVWSPPRLL